MDVQTLIVYLIVALAALTLFRRLVTATRGSRGKKSCGGSCGCGTSTPPMVRRS